MLTTNGLAQINAYLSGQVSEWAGTLAFGCLSSSSTTLTTSSLQYEIARYPVTFKSYRTVSGSNQIVVKTSMEPTADFDIYEIGIIPAKVNLDNYFDNQKITNFSETSAGSSLWYIGATTATTLSTSPTPRSGTLLLAIPGGSTASISGLNIDVSYYSDSDILNLLYYSGSVANTASVTITFGDSGVPQTVWTSSTVALNTTASTFANAALSMGTRPSNFLNPVYSASVAVTGTGTILMDHLKFNLNNQFSSELQLVSRTTTASAGPSLFSKLPSQPMEVEYYIQVT